MNSKEPKAFIKTLISLVLVTLCLIAANWQYQRGVVRHANNYQIESNLTLTKIDLNLIEDFQANEWRTVTAVGTFETSHDVLLRNRYNENGVYGYEYLSLFKSDNRQFWVDRGWVKAGASATERPDIPKTREGQIKITGRIRLDSALPRGSFFALPSKGNLVSEWNLQSKIQTEDFYLDLIEGSGVTPEVPAQLPELSDGPHMAYALQWLFFAGLIIYGRILIRKR